MPDDGALELLYRKSWSQADEFCDETGATSAEIAQQLLENLLIELRLADFSGLRIMDFGAGRGAVSTALREMRATPISIEPFGHEYLRARGHEPYPSLADLPPDLMLDGIVMTEVIEHLTAPVPVLEALASRLRPGGWIFMTTPNPKGLAARLLGPRWSAVRNQGHVAIYTPSGLAGVLERSGFTSPRRLFWRFRYPGVTPGRRMIHWLMQKLRIDGALRMLAIKP